MAAILHQHGATGAQHGRIRPYAARSGPILAPVTQTTRVRVVTWQRGTETTLSSTRPAIDTRQCTHTNKVCNVACNDWSLQSYAVIQGAIIKRAYARAIEENLLLYQFTLNRILSRFGQLCSRAEVG
jgi:hypothetical protein